jgi:hypothetical protein
VPPVRSRAVVPAASGGTSCQSGGPGDDQRSADRGALAALSPRLAEAGVQAVLAMQGNISMTTVARLMPRGPLAPRPAIPA